MSAAESVQVEPADIVMLGDDILAHLKHFSHAERIAIALYLLSETKVASEPVDLAAGQSLAARAAAVRLAEART